ncbi:quinone oxidoreductase family protein [Herbidospora yilanensis]|uniref:quinone oxidoreductase family protein n=1 Tax=Herbidospora yilanensis TaxID=354426 RepID=UPI000783D872|nr:quinone oxidoreductase [Herbidospora yilanensis]
MRAIIVTTPGGSSALDHAEVPDPVPGEGEALVEVAASGVNFIDVYHREGRYPLPTPFVPGSEGAGTVCATGPGVTEVGLGDRVAWANVVGSYAEKQIVPADRLVPVPDRLDLDLAAAVLLQGMTAHYLTRSTHDVREGEVVLIHAAAGGMGLLLIQMAKMRGAHVIGTVSSAAKEKLARAAGADEVLRYGDVAAGVRNRCHVVYDGVGAATFEDSLAALRPRGLLALYGAASGPVPPFDPQRLNAAGSLFLTRPTLGHYVATRAELLERADDVLGWVADGSLDVAVYNRYPLAEARRAHDDLEGRRTTGKLLLIP